MRPSIVGLRDGKEEQKIRRATPISARSWVFFPTSSYGDHVSEPLSSNDCTVTRAIRALSSFCHFHIRRSTANCVPQVFPAPSSCWCGSHALTAAEWVLHAVGARSLYFLYCRQPQRPPKSSRKCPLKRCAPRHDRSRVTA